ncbi:MAG: hypothetical protein ACUVQ9_12900 [Thermodesulfobacteriota bacterium]
MANIKPLEISSDKWVRRASVAGPDYQNGIQSPRREWAAAAKAGEANYKAGVLEAVNRGAYVAGIVAAGDEKWRANSLAKGPSRFAEGVALAKDLWQKGFAPYHAAIASLQLPPRGAKGSPQNLQRVNAIATALRALRVKK